MKITELPHTCDQYFLDGSFVSMNNYVVINDRMEVFRNGKVITLQEPILTKWLRVRVLSPNRFLVVADHFETGEENPNGWIINNEGLIEKAIYLDDVYCVFSTEKYIITSSNESVYPNRIAVFDWNGKEVFIYDNEAQEKTNSPGFWENYAFLGKDERSIYFMPYTDFPLIEFNLIDFSAKVVATVPSEKELGNDSFWNPKAFTKKGEDWYFITPDYDHFCSRVFRMNPAKEIEEIGQCCFSILPKGLPGGKFFVPYSGNNPNNNTCQIVEI
ncbi:MAG: hypothetical protein AB8F95_04495 [Bacteroidia bacterium]